MATQRIRQQNQQPKQQRKPREKQTNEALEVRKANERWMAQRQGLAPAVGHKHHLLNVRTRTRARARARAHTSTRTLAQTSTRTRTRARARTRTHTKPPHYAVTRWPSGGNMWRARECAVHSLIHPYGLVSTTKRLIIIAYSIYYTTLVPSLIHPYGLVRHNDS